MPEKGGIIIVPERTEEEKFSHKTTAQVYSPSLVESCCTHVSRLRWTFGSLIHMHVDISACDYPNGRVKESVRLNFPHFVHI